MLLLGGRFHAATFLRRAVCVPAHRGCRSSYSILIITLVLVLAVGAPASAADQAGARAPADPQEQQADAEGTSHADPYGYSCAGGQSRRGHQALAGDAKCLRGRNRGRAGARGPSSGCVGERSPEKPV